MRNALPTLGRAFLQFPYMEIVIPPLHPPLFRAILPIYHLTERSAVECAGLWASDSSQKETLNTIHGRSAPFFTDTTQKTVSVGNGIAPRAFGMAVFFRPFSLAHERMVLL